MWVMVLLWFIFRMLIGYLIMFFSIVRWFYRLKCWKIIVSWLWIFCNCWGLVVCSLFRVLGWVCSFLLLMWMCLV